MYVLREVRDLHDVGSYGDFDEAKTIGGQLKNIVDGCNKFGTKIHSITQMNDGSLAVLLEVYP